jgi:spore maturation protein CgeB
MNSPSERTKLNIIILGLSITSSWGNGHAVTYRGVISELVRRGHRVLFLERDVPWYAENRDLPKLPYGNLGLYSNVDQLQSLYRNEFRSADCVIVGSFVPDAIVIADWLKFVVNGVFAFYDIDTPVTLNSVEHGSCTYLSSSSIPDFDLYLSFTGGPILRRLENEFGSPMARVLYCSADPSNYFPESKQDRWDLGYLGTYSSDRQPTLDSLLVKAARQWPEGHFVVAGPQYPAELEWPNNVERIEHLPPLAHRGFYNSQRVTLNITRADMIRCGYSPSIRLFEAAACASPIITDYWQGLETVFDIGKEILVAEDGDQVLKQLRDTPQSNLNEIGWNARRRVLAEHTATHRAEALEHYILEARSRRLRSKQFA